MISTQTKITRLYGLIGTKDLSEKEAKFVENLRAKAAKIGPVNLSDDQQDWLDDLFAKHFAG